MEEHFYWGKGPGMKKAIDCFVPNVQLNNIVVEVGLEKNKKTIKIIVFSMKTMPTVK